MNATVGGGGSWTWGNNNVTVQTMDIDGDGLPDRVLRIPGSGYMYVRRNLAGPVGLLRSIRQPQGGVTELDYEGVPALEDLPKRALPVHHSDRGCQYNEFGQRVAMEYGNGVRTEYSCNPERRWLERIVTVDGTGTKLQNITYDINPVGNVRGYENAADGYSTKQTYEYDNLYQLVKVDGESKNYQAGSGLVTMSSTYSQVFSFDGAGNGKLAGKTSSERTMGTRNGDNLNYSDTIILIACNTGKNDEKSGTSFAQKLADEFGPGTVVKAPDDYIYVFYHFGEVAVGPYYPDIEGPYDRRLKLVHPIDNYRYLKTFEYRSPSERRRR